MKYVLAIIGSIIWYYLIGWVIKDIVFAATFSESETIKALTYREVLCYAIAATIWLVLGFFIHKDENLSEKGAKIWVACALAVWVAYILMTNVLPMTGGTIVIVWLVTLGSMITGACIVASTLK